ncbi:MAG TPA: esterase, partial [Cytophagales bacterium]|nr:esterase [Cytophagales bacterium]
YGTAPAIWEAVGSAAPTEADRNQAIATYAAGRDAKAAVRWVYANAEAYQINTHYITALGGSAGALLSVMLGVTEPEDYRDELTVDQDPTLATTHLDQPSTVHTILDFWGSDGLVSALEGAYGHQRFDATDAPILIVHGDEDPTVAFSEAIDLRDTYESTGAQYEFHQLVGQGHSVWRATVAGKGLDELAFDFVVAQQSLTVE